MKVRENIQRLVADAEELVKETKRCVDLGWERKSRLKEAEEHLEHVKKLLQEVE